MATFDVFNMQREKVGSIDLADEVFGVEVKEHLFYEVVKAQLASKRQGTRAGKNRSAVSGSTKKLYKQKGTGRARHGSIRAPVYVGGGQGAPAASPGLVVRAPAPRARPGAHERPDEVRQGRAPARRRRGSTSPRSRRSGSSRPSARSRRRSGRSSSTPARTRSSSSRFATARVTSSCPPRASTSTTSCGTTPSSFPRTRPRSSSSAA